MIFFVFFCIVLTKSNMNYILLFPGEKACHVWSHVVSSDTEKCIYPCDQEEADTRIVSK